MGCKFFGITYFGYHHMAKERAGKTKLLSMPKVSPEDALGYHLMNTFAEAFERHQQNEISNREWETWLSWMKLSFKHESMLMIWGNNSQLKEYFDPSFREFINNEVISITIMAN